MVETPKEAVRRLAIKMNLMTLRQRRELYMLSIRRTVSHEFFIGLAGALSSLEDNLKRIDVMIVQLRQHVLEAEDRAVAEVVEQQQRAMRGLSGVRLRSDLALLDRAAADDYIVRTMEGIEENRKRRLEFDEETDNDL